MKRDRKGGGGLHFYGWFTVCDHDITSSLSDENFLLDWKLIYLIAINISELMCETPQRSPVSLTCSVDVKVCGFVGDVAHRFDSWAFDRDLGGVAQCLVHVHLKWTFGNRLACKQHRHLGNSNYSNYPE